MSKATLHQGVIISKNGKEVVLKWIQQKVPRP